MRLHCSRAQEHGGGASFNTSVSETYVEEVQIFCSRRLFLNHIDSHF